jgi:hypothetical protein
VLSRCDLSRRNLSAVCSVSVATATSVSPIWKTSSWNGFSEGTPVSIETRRLILRSSDSGPHQLGLIPHLPHRIVCSRAPPVNKLLFIPLNGNRVEEGRCRRSCPAGFHIFTLFKRSLLPRGDLKLVRQTVSLVCLLVAHTNLP